ncbi:MAG: PAS domain-containing protein [Deltaproteobacteria bacterium]|nr:PAS domain-containing protein [Deltaproteobacteria bacterium]
MDTNYKNVGLSEYFLCESEASPPALVFELNKKIAEQIKEPVLTGEGFAVESNYGGNDYCVVFSPIKNFNNETAAYLIAYVKDTVRATLFSQFIINLIFTNTSLLSIVALFFFLNLKNRALKNAQLEFKTFAEFTYDAEYWVNPDKTFRYLSPSFEKITGYPRECFLESSEFLREITLPEDRCIIDAHETDIHDTLADGSMKFRIRHKSGNIIWIEHYCTPVTDDKGKNIGFRACNRDITERIKDEELKSSLKKELAYKEKIESLNVMAGSIAHKFNNSLTVVLANLEMGLEMSHNIMEMRSYVNDAYMAAEKSAEISRLMLGYVGQYQLTKAPVKIENILHKAVALVQSNARKPFTANLVVPANHLTMEGDYELVLDALIRVLDNAAEAIADMQNQGEITIEVAEKNCKKNYFHPVFHDKLLHGGCFSSISITDNGIGMPEDIVSKMFDPFFTTHFTGRGLGLAYVAGIMRSHHGGIHVESEPGKKTTLELLFPKTPVKPKIPDISLNADKYR